jgi:hypothetical protein
VGVGSAVIGWWCKQVWDATQSLKDAVQRIEVDLPTNYVLKADMNVRFDKIEQMLAKIFDKLDTKVDK